MEYLLAAAVVFGFAAAVVLREVYRSQKREKLFVASLSENYGKKPKKEYSLERFARIDRYFQRHRRPGQVDDITWNDLEMDRLFRRMDSTLSASGEEYLYYTLRNTARTREELLHLEEAVAFFSLHERERIQVQCLMHRLGRMGKYSLYDYLDNLDYLGERSGRRHILCDLLFLPFLLAAPFFLAPSFLGISILAAYNIMTYFREKREVEPYFTSFDYVLRLQSVCEELGKLSIPACREEWERMRRHVSALKCVQRGSFLVLSGSRGVNTGNPLDLLFDYVKMIFHVDLIWFYRMLGKLKGRLADVDGLFTCVGYVETAVAVGAFRRSLKDGYCLPEFVENGPFRLEGGYHPLIENPVKNSVEASGGVLITGSNASGKSTFLRMTAVNAILAQTVHTCAADRYCAPLYDIYSSMSLRDNMEGGESYYIVEIRSLKRILDAAGKGERPVLCFVDEVLRGTNTVERIAAASQILMRLSGEGVQCFAATHDIEITHLLEGEYDNYHFEEAVRDNDILFSYLLQKGRASTRNAIRLLQIMGYDEEIIRQAERRAQRFTETGVWERQQK